MSRQAGSVFIAAILASSAAGQAESPTTKQLTARQKRAKTRDPNRGLDCKAHKADGFLADANGFP